MTPDLKENTIDELNLFEGDPSLILTENPDGLWKKLEFDPTNIIKNPKNTLTLEGNKLALGPAVQNSGTLANPTTFPSTLDPVGYGPGYIAATNVWPGRNGATYNDLICAILGGKFGGRIGVEAYAYIAINSELIQILTTGDSGYMFAGTDSENQDPHKDFMFGIDRTGAYKQLSDKSAKHSIAPMKDDILPKLKNLQVKTFGFKVRSDENSSKEKKKSQSEKFFKKHLGLVADDVEKILPEIIHGLGYLSKKEADLDQADPDLIKAFAPKEPSNGNKMINMSHLQIYMLKAIQELAEIVDSLKKGKQ